jgi:hypothetical protein
MRLMRRWRGETWRLPQSSAGGSSRTARRQERPLMLKFANKQTHCHTISMLTFGCACRLSLRRPSHALRCRALQRLNRKGQLTILRRSSFSGTHLLTLSDSSAGERHLLSRAWVRLCSNYNQSIQVERLRTQAVKHIMVGGKQAQQPLQRRICARLPSILAMQEGRLCSGSTGV